MFSIQYCVLREKSDFKIWHEDGSIFTLKPCNDNIKCEILNPRIFHSNLNNIFRNEYQVFADIQLSPRSQDKQISGFSCDTGAGQLMNYFVPKYFVATKWPVVYTMDEVFNSEREFLRYYKETLQNF